MSAVGQLCGRLLAVTCKTPLPCSPDPSFDFMKSSSMTYSPSSSLTAAAASSKGVKRKKPYQPTLKLTIPQRAAKLPLVERSPPVVAANPPLKEVAASKKATITLSIPPRPLAALQTSVHQTSKLKSKVLFLMPAQSWPRWCCTTDLSLLLSSFSRSQPPSRRIETRPMVRTRKAKIR